MKVFKTAVFLTALLVLSPHALAVTYQYTALYNFPGFNISDDPLLDGMYTTSMGVTGTVTFNAIPDGFYGDVSTLITSYSFSDGRSNLTEANSAIDIGSSYLIASGGWITGWFLEFETPSFDTPGVLGTTYSRIVTSDNGESGAIRECYLICDIVLEDRAHVSYEITEMGIWMVTAVPVPAAAWLFGSALLGLGLFRGNRGRQSGIE